jgi:CubicO group peptidase (beta-lactamase class C family)
MSRRFAILSIATVIALTAQVRQPAARATTAATAAPADRFKRVDRLIQSYVDDNRIAGAVVLLLHDGKPIYERAFGWADKEAGRRMTTDTIFRIASQTKSITSAAVLALVEEGKIGIHEPVWHFIPTFKQTNVAVRDSAGLKFVPAKRPITVHDLLTHTAGVSYGTDEHLGQMYSAQGLGPSAGRGWYTADKNEPVCETMERLGTLPFAAQPGEAYVYGYNTDILGCIVEKASGMPFDEFVRTRITSPLGMKDTRFYLPPDERDRIATVYASGPDGRFMRAEEGAKGQGHYVAGPRKSFSGGAGLTSTARDYARFLEAIRNGGILNGARILSPRTARLMTTNQAGTLRGTNGLGFGYGFETVDRYGASGLAGTGAFGWSGAYGTTYQVDPESRTVIVFMMQLMPNATDIQPKFYATVYQALP